MRKGLIAILFCLISGALAHAQSPVQCLYQGVWTPCSLVTNVQLAQAANTKVSAGAGTTITNAFGSNTTAGNTILCLGFESAAAIPVITDAQSNTYVVASSSATAPGYTVAIATSIVGGTTDTITETTTSGAASFACYELKGTFSVGQVWDALNAQQGTAGSIAFASQNIEVSGEAIFAAAGFNAGTINATPTLGNSVTGLTTVDASNTAVTGGAALAVFYAAHTNQNNPLALSQTLSLSASETFSGVLVSIKPAVFPVVQEDPCAQPVKLQQPFSITANTQEITGTAGQNIYICSADIVVGAATNVALVEGTGSTCATNIAGMAGGTTAATGWNFAANDGLAKGNGTGTVYRTVTTGDNVCLLVSAANQTSGSFQYVKQ